MLVETFRDGLPAHKPVDDAKDHPATDLPEPARVKDRRAAK